jgi:hypothetical protein
MSIDVEVNLRIPAVKDPAKDEHGYPINNANVRFARAAKVTAIPQPGALLQLETRAGTPIECEVHRADWSDRRELFIVYCRYSKRSMPAHEYQALLNDPDWEMRPL